MSIINQMLEKLEQRRGGRDASMPDGVRAVVRAAGGNNRRFLLPGVLAIVLASGGYYGWLWQQRHAKPVKSVAAVGKIPGAEMQPEVVEQQLVPKIEEAPASLTAPQQEEATTPSAESSQKTVAKKKKDLSAEKPAPSAKESKTDEMASSVSVTPASGAAKKVSRESSGKIRTAGGEQEMPMKSVTPQQLALSHYQKALSWLQQGRVAEARSGLEDALKLYPAYLSARQALAGLLVEQRQFGQAEHVLQEGLSLSPEQSGFAMALARLQVERGDIRTALGTLNGGLPHAADNAEYQAFLAALLQRSEQHKKAIEHYQAALRLGASATWQMGLGISLQAEHRLPEALEAFGRAKLSSELTPDLMAFVEQRMRMIKAQMR